MPDRSSFSAESEAGKADSQEIERRLAFLGLTEHDAGQLRRLSPAFRENADQFVETFYRYLFSFEETARFLQDPQRVERLKVVQRDHFISLLEARWDEQYFEDRRRVGQTHAETGIEPHLVLGAYNQYVQHCLGCLTADRDAATQGLVDQVLPLVKVILLDIGLTLEAYFDQLTRDMRAALDMFWKANTELRQFAQLASHDLKTPLATVANLCDEALDEFGDEMPAGARELLRKAHQRIFGMSTTIDELLAASISSPDQPHAEVSCAEVLREAVDRVRPVMEKKGIELTVAGNLPRVRGDRVRLREAFYNLLANAVKFIDKSPGRIDVSHHGEGEFCVITIADNGPGIPADELQRVFVPFRRLPVHRQLPGSGLGLYFTKNLIEQQGGQVWVDSELHAGSRFRVRLPVASAR